MLIGSKIFLLMQVIAWTLLHSIWQGLVALLIYLAVRRLLKNPSRRYLVGFLCIIGFVVVQVCTFVLCAKWSAGSGLELPLSLSSDTASQSYVVRPINNFGTLMPIALPAESWLLKLARTLSPLIFWVSILWIIGFWLYTIRFLIALVLLRAELNRCIPLAAERVENFRQLAQKIHLERPVKFVESQELSVPATCGLLQPVVLIPVKRLIKLPGRFLDALVLHELAHIFRRDSLTHRICYLVQSIYIFHPLVRWMGKQMTNDSEKAADEIAADALGDKKVYAKALVSMEEARVGMLKLGASGGSLRDRLFHIIASHEAKRQNASRLSILFVLLCCLMMAMALSEVIVRAASPDQRLSVWVNERSLPEAVLETFNIDTTIDNASPAIERAVLELEQTGSVTHSTLSSLADAIHSGIVPDRMTGEWRGWIKQRSADMRKQKFPVIGSADERIDVALRLTELARKTNDSALQAHYARAAYVMLTLEVAVIHGIDSQKWISSPENLAMLNLEGETERKIDFAVARHHARIASTREILGGIRGVPQPDSELALTSAAYLPYEQLRLTDTATTQDTQLVREFLLVAPEEIRLRWLALNPNLGR